MPKMRLETVGDLTGLLMMLLNSGILHIIGEREESHLLNEDTVSIQFNPTLAPYLDMIYISRGKERRLSLDDTLLNIKSHRIFQDLLKWEKMNFVYQASIKSAGENPNEAIQAVLNEILETKEKVELELQKSQILLDTSDGIKLKINPDYLSNH